MTTDKSPMLQIINNAWQEDDGVLSFEWTLIVVLVVFGIVGGMAAIRDILIEELAEVSKAAVSWDQSFSYTGIPALGIPGSTYTDIADTVTDCGRNSNFGAPVRNDADNGA